MSIEGIPIGQKPQGYIMASLAEGKANAYVCLDVWKQEGKVKPQPPLPDGESARVDEINCQHMFDPSMHTPLVGVPPLDPRCCEQKHIENTFYTRIYHFSK